MWFAMSKDENIKPLNYIDQLQLKTDVDMFQAIDNIFENSASIITSIINNNEDDRIKLNAIRTAVGIRKQLSDEQQFMLKFKAEQDKNASPEIDWGDAGIE